MDEWMDGWMDGWIDGCFSAQLFLLLTLNFYQRQRSMLAC